jgi:hypothetical protein
MVFCNWKSWCLAFAFAIRGDNAKLSVRHGMLEPRFLGCKSGSRALYTYRELVPALKREIYTGIVGGKALNRRNHIKNTELVMDEEGRRTMGEIYKGSTANFASIRLSTSHSIHIR